MTATEPLLILISTALALLACLWLGFRRIRERTRIERLGVEWLFRLERADLLQLLQRAQLKRGAILDHSSDHHGVSTAYDFVYDRSGSRELLACRHRDEARVDRQCLDELAAARVPAAARYALLATTRRVPASVGNHAKSLGIELISGNATWRWLQEFVPERKLVELTLRAHREVRRAANGAWFLLGLSAVLAFGPQLVAMVDAPTDFAGSGATILAVEPAPTALNETQRGIAPASPEPVDPETLIAMRASSARAVRELPGIASVVWPTESTLLIVLATNDVGPTKELIRSVCNALNAHAELGAVRLQFSNKATGSAGEQKIRWGLCEGNNALHEGSSSGASSNETGSGEHSVPP